MAVIPLSFSAGGGGGSDEVTATRAEVLSGVTAITSDSNDEPVEGTLVRRGDYTAPVSMAAGGDNIYVRIQNGAYIRDGGYPEIVVPKTAFGDAVASNVLSGKTFTGADGLATAGGMPNNGAVSHELSAGGSYTVPEGYHSGSGIVTAKSLSSQTPGDATAANILTGKKAWVAGVQLTGSMQSQAGGTYNPTTSVKTLATGGKYLTSDVKVNGFTLPSASIIKKGATYSLYGQTVTGTWEGYASSPLYIVQEGVVKNLSTNSFSHTSKCTIGSTAVLEYDGSGNWARSDATFNLTNYKYIKFRAYKNTSYDSVYGVGTSSTSPSKTINIAKEPGGVHIIDVSSLSGAYYIFLKTGGSQTSITGVYDIYVSTT